MEEEGDCEGDEGEERNCEELEDVLVAVVCKWVGR